MMNRSKIITDLLFFFGVFLMNISKLTGITLHEWIGIPVTVLLLVHLTLNWNPFFGGIRHFRKISRKKKIDLILDLFLYWVMAVTLFSGFITSRALLPFLGCPIQIDSFFCFLHKRFPTILTVILGIHLGMHIIWLKAWFTRKERKGGAE